MIRDAMTQRQTLGNILMHFPAVVLLRLSPILAASSTLGHPIPFADVTVRHFPMS